MKKKQTIEEKPLSHACILCKKKNICKVRLAFPLDCDENDCSEFEHDTRVDIIAP